MAEMYQSSGGSFDVIDRQAHPRTTVSETLENIARAREARQLPVFPLHSSLVRATPPRQVQELWEASAHRCDLFWQNTPREGSEGLRQDIARWRGGLFQERITSENVVVTSGARSAFFQALMALTSPGDGVLLMPPCFPKFREAILRRGAEVIEVPLERGSGYQPNLPRISVQCGERCKLLVVTSPNNPTGNFIEGQALRSLSRIASRNEGVLLIDETFAALDLRSDPVPPPALPLRRTVYIGSFAESFSLAQAQVGYLIGPQSLVARIVDMQEDLQAPASILSQQLARAALQGSEEHLCAVTAELKSRLAKFQNVLSRIAGITRIFCGGGPFLWAEIDQYSKSTYDLVVQLAKETGALVRPGEEYGGRQAIRICFGMLDAAQLSEVPAALSSFSGWSPARRGRTSEPRQRWDAGASLPAPPEDSELL